MASAGTFSDPQFVIGTVGGNLEPAVSVNQLFARWIATHDCVIGGIQADARNAGTGTGSTVLDVTVNGTSIWTTAANRPTLAVASTGAFALSRPYATTVKRGDRVIVTVATIPTTTGHAGVSCTVAIERSH